MFRTVGGVAHQIDMDLLAREAGRDRDDMKHGELVGEQFDAEGREHVEPQAAPMPRLGQARIVRQAGAAAGFEFGKLVLVVEAQAVMLGRFARVHRGELDEAGMDGEHMVGLDVVLVGQLPVRLEIEGDGAGIAQACEIVALHAPGHGLEIIVQRGGVARDIDEDQVQPPA